MLLSASLTPPQLEAVKTLAKLAVDSAETSGAILAAGAIPRLGLLMGSLDLNVQVLMAPQD